MDEISLKEIIEVLIKGKWVIVIVAITVLLLGSILTYIVMDPVFEAKSVVEIQEAVPARLPDIPGLDLGKSRDFYALPNLRQYVSSSFFWEKMVHNLNLEADSTLPLRESVKIEQIPDSNMFTIRVLYKNSDLAAEIANGTAQLMTEELLNYKKEQVEDAFKFLENLVAENERLLLSAEKDISDFIEAKGFIDRESIANSGKTMALVDYQIRLSEMRIRLAAARAEKNALEKELQSIPQKITLKTSKEAGSEEDTILTEDLNPLYTALMEKLKTLNVEIASLNRALDETQKVIRDMEKDLTETRAEQFVIIAQLDRLERKYKHYMLNVEEWEGHYLQLQVMAPALLKGAEIRLISEAFPQSSPIRPNKKFNLVASLLLGIALGMVGAYFVDYWKTTPAGTKIETR